MLAAEEIQYDDLPTDFELFYRRHVHKHFFRYSLFKLMGDVTGKSVLDLGCNEGHYSRLIKEKGATKVVGVDVSLRMIREAEHCERLTRLGIDYFTCRLSDLCHPSQFDVVCMMQTLNHVNSQESLLQLCGVAYRHLTPGGRLVAIVSYRQQSRSYFDFRNVGLEISCTESASTGSRAIAKLFLADRPNLEHLYDTYSLFDKAIFEFYLKRVGFSLLEWQPCSVEPHAGYVEEVWEDVVTSQFFMSVTCVKIV